MTMYPEEQEPTMEEELDEDSAPDFVDPDNLEDCTVVADLDEDDAPPEESDDDEGEEPGQGAAASAANSDAEGDEQLMEYDGPEDSLNVLRAHGDAVVSLAWHPTDPHVLASGACDDKAFISRVVGSGPEAVVQQVELAGHTDTIASLAWSTDGALLATGGLDASVMVWDVNGVKKATLEGPVEGVEFVTWHPRGAVVLAGSEDFSAWMWNAASGACMQVFTGHSGSVNCGAFTPDGKTVVTGSMDCTLRVWDPRSGASTFTVQGHPYHEGPLTCLAVSPDGAVVLTGSEDKTARVVLLATGKCKGTLAGHTDSVECVAFAPPSPGLQLAATGSMDGTVLVWDTNTMQQRCSLPHGDGDGVVRLAFHPTNPGVLYTACLDGKLRVWDARSGQCTRTLGGHAAGLQDVAVRPDGQLVATAADDHTVRLFSALA